MTDLTDEAVATAPAKERASDRGSFIWYELMTDDAGRVGPFYEAVAGWTVSPPHGRNFQTKPTQ